MKRLFFFDIDGTLIECEKGIYNIQDEVWKLLDDLKKQGDDVFLATGRCKCFIPDTVMEYPFSGYVTCNGAYVEYKNQCTYKEVVPYEAFKKTHELCKARKLAYYFENSDYICVLDKDHPRHIEFRDKWGMKDEITIDEFDISKVETYIGMIVANSEEDVPFIKESLSDYFDIQQHNNGLSFDLTLKGESKAKGIKELAKALNVPVENTVAFGDGRNDVEMLSEVGLGIAMGNGAQEAKDAAKFVTKDISDHGIMYAIEYFSLLR